MSHSKNMDIQALRGIAILMVMLQHYRGRLPTSQGYERVFDFFSFWTGVDLFFAISGFVIVRSLLASTGIGDNRRLLTSEFLAFCKRRFVRLAPASWFWLTVGLCLLLTIPELGTAGPSAAIQSALAGITATANFYWSMCVTSGVLGTVCPHPDITGVHWSLSVEEQFYLLLALSLLFLPLRQAIFLWGIIAVAFTAYALAFHEMRMFSPLWVIRPQSLIIGVVLGMFAGGGQFAPKSESVRTALTLSAVAALCFSTKNHDINLVIPLAALISGAVVYLAVRDGSISRGAGKYLCWIGDRSYSIYLSHLMVYHLVRYLLLASGHSHLYTAPSNALGLAFVILAFVTALAVGHISFIYIERPRWLHRVLLQRRGQIPS